MAEIPSNRYKGHISNIEINWCINEFNKIKNHNENKSQVLTLKINTHVTDIDFTLIAYFILFKKEIPKLKIILDLTKNHLPMKANGYRDRRIYGQLNQLWAYSYLFFNEGVFSVKYSGKTNFLTVGDALVSDLIFRVSSSFLPPIYIDKNEYYGIYFNEDYGEYLESNLESFLKNKLLKQLQPEQISTEHFRKTLEIQNVKKLIISKHSITSKNKILELATLAFIDSLNNAKLLEVYAYQLLNKSAYLKKVNLEELRIGRIKYKNNKDYFNKIKHIYNDLLKKPLIYSYIYSLLLSSDVRDKSKWNFLAENTGTHTDNLSNLWEFTKKLVRGLTELAKNIIEHSTTGQGVILARIHRKENSLFHEYGQLLKESDKDNINSLISINICDLGTKGVITTLEESTQKLLTRVEYTLVEGIQKLMTGVIPTLEKSTQLLLTEVNNASELKNIVTNDLNTIRNSEFSFENLVDPHTSVFLLQQAKRSIAHFGLLTLSKLISDEKGALFVSTSGFSCERDIAFIPKNQSKVDKARALLEIKEGTQLSIILPVNIEKSFINTNQKINEPDVTTTADDIEGLEKLVSYELIDEEKNYTNDDSRTYILNVQPDIGTIKNRDQELELKECILDNSQLKQSLRNTIICLDLDKCNFTDKDAHILFRLLGSLEISLSGIPFILLNIHYTLLHKLIETNKIFCEGANIDIFWSEDKPTIVYSYDKDNDSKFYFTDVLWGKTEQRFSDLNNLISSTYYNSISTLYKSVSSELTYFFQNSNLLINGCIPLPFDVLIKYKSQSLFELNASVLLDTNLIPSSTHLINEQSGLLEQIKTRPGYKIPNTHFKVGSKVHISDFYYAKRFFQSGSFASHMSFILAKSIYQQIQEKNSEIITNGNPSITLIGYGLYSELLLNLTEKFLVNNFNCDDHRINHDIIIDSESLELKKSSTTHDHAIIIVPISTTFSTAIKIQEKLYERKIFEKGNILSPHYTLLYISDGTPSNKCTETEEKLGWVDRNKKTEENIITVKATHSDANTVHKYYLPLPTKWHSVDTCEMCFPPLPKAETVLFETDKSSVTPALIFTAPKGRTIENHDLYRENIKLEGLVRYGHHRRNNHHFLHSIKSEEFLRKNINEVKDWLIKLKQNDHFTNEHKQNEKVLIISQCHHTNAPFINLTNKYLFSSSANIIHYDPNNDFIQNFKMIYEKEIEEADRIVFVDDSLKSGKTLSRINFYIQQAFNYKSKKDKKGIHTCITLMNKSQIYTQQWVENLLVDKYCVFSFFNRHLYTDHEQLEYSSIETEQKRYTALISVSALDTLKRHFLEQIIKVSEIKKNTHEEKNNPYEDEKNTPPELILNATHFLIEYLTNGETERFREHLPIIDAVFAEKEYQDYQSATSPSFYRKYFFEKNIKESKMYLHLFSENTDEQVLKALLKVLTRPPFTLHMPVRKLVFPWVIEELLAALHVVIKTNDQKKLKNSIRTLKFHMRRASEMNSNILISREFLNGLKVVYEKESLLESISDDLGVYFVSQVKELLFKNNSRCIRLQLVISDLYTDQIGTSLFFKQLLRMLTSENIIIITSFLYYIEKKDVWKFLYGSSDNNAVDIKNNNIEIFLKTPPIIESNKFTILNKYLLSCGEEKAISNKPFLNFLWLNHFFLNEHNNKINKKNDGEFITLDEKTQHILSKMSEIIEFGVRLLDDSLSVKVGKFLVVNDINSKPLVVYARDEKDHPLSIDATYLSTDVNSYPTAMLEGLLATSKKSKKSVVELYKSPKNTWLDLYATKSEDEASIVDNNIISNTCNRVLLFRINNMTIDLNTTMVSKDQFGDESLAVIGFYFKIKGKAKNKPIPASIIKYILLNRENLKQFIQDHHNNNEFVEFQQASFIKKLASLTGHGQDTLRQLASNNKSDGIFGPISATLTSIQTTILLVDGEYKNSYPPFKLISNILGSKVPFKSKHIDKFKKLAEAIYQLKEIEYSVDIENEILLIFPGKSFFRRKVLSNFKINLKVLDVIFYELFVNAKKNMWVFSDDEEPILGSNTYVTNQLIFNLESSDNEIIFTIRNTCPKSPQKFINRLNNDKAEIKNNSPVSGINLVKQLVNKSLDARIHFDQETTSTSKFSIFSVQLKFQVNGKND